MWGWGVGEGDDTLLHQGPHALENFTVGWGHRLELIWKLEQELRKRGWSRPSAKLAVAEVRLEALGHGERTVQSPDAWLKNLTQATAVVQRFQSDVMWPDFNSEKKKIILAAGWRISSSLKHGRRSPRGSGRVGEERAKSGCSGDTRIFLFLKK